VVIVTHSPILLSACRDLFALDRGRLALAGPAQEILPKLFGAGARAAGIPPSASPKQRTEEPASGSRIVATTPTKRPIRAAPPVVAAPPVPKEAAEARPPLRPRPVVADAPIEEAAPPLRTALLHTIASPAAPDEPKRARATVADDPVKGTPAHTVASPALPNEPKRTRAAVVDVPADMVPPARPPLLHSIVSPTAVGATKRPHPAITDEPKAPAAPKQLPREASGWADGPGGHSAEPSGTRPLLRVATVERPAGIKPVAPVARPHAPRPADDKHYPADDEDDPPPRHRRPHLTVTEGGKKATGTNGMAPAPEADDIGEA
jgi:ATP-binding cassette subfamily C protein LapB